MTGPRRDPTLDRIWSGAPLSSADERHVATCVACQRATSEVRVLEARLREATRPLASTPIPDDVFEVEPMRPTALDRIGGRNMGLAAAAVVVLAAVAVGLAISPWRPSVAVDPSAEATRTAQPSPSASATTAPTPAPSHTSPADHVGAHLVGPLSFCADGIGGFGISLPDGLYAERRQGTSPGCRSVGTIREVDGRQVLDAMISLGVDEAPPAFEGGTIEAEEARRSESGVELTRYVVRTPEIGALAGSFEVTYVAELMDGRYLTASTDASDEGWVARLDALMERLWLTEPITVSSAAALRAAELYAVRDVCEDPERGLTVVFPDDWWTNTAIDDLPACSWFAPAFFEYESSEIVPDEVEIAMALVDGTVATIHEIVSQETLTLIGLPATRWVTEADGVRTYEYVIELGTPEAGPDLALATTAEPADLDAAMAMLDELVQHISFAQPPPGATSDNPYLSGPPVSAEATEGDFHLELNAQQGRYRAGQPIIADMTLTYLGDEPTISLWGSGMGVIGSRLRQVDGTIEHGWTTTSDCRPHEITPGEPMRRPFVKSGSWSADEPNGDFYEAYFRDPLLRLPPGRWELTAVTGFTAGGEDCGDGPAGGLEVSVEITVEP